MEASLITLSTDQNTPTPPFDVVSKIWVLKPSDIFLLYLIKYIRKIFFASLWYWYFYSSLILVLFFFNKAYIKKLLRAPSKRTTTYTVSPKYRYYTGGKKVGFYTIKVGYDIPFLYAPVFLVQYVKVLLNTGTLNDFRHNTY